jgi:hypothetical protein
VGLNGTALFIVIYHGKTSDGNLLRGLDLARSIKKLQPLTPARLLVGVVVSQWSYQMHTLGLVAIGCDSLMTSDNCLDDEELISLSLPLLTRKIRSPVTVTVRAKDWPHIHSSIS